MRFNFCLFVRTMQTVLANLSMNRFSTKPQTKKSKENLDSHLWTIYANWSKILYMIISDLWTHQHKHHYSMRIFIAQRPALSNNNACVLVLPYTSLLCWRSFRLCTITPINRVRSKTSLMITKGLDKKDFFGGGWNVSMKIKHVFQ